MHVTEDKDNPALRLYHRSLAQQWNPDKDIDWTLSTIVDPAIAPARARLVNELYWSERQSLWTVKRMNTPIQWIRQCLRGLDAHASERARQSLQPLRDRAGGDRARLRFVVRRPGPCG